MTDRDAFDKAFVERDLRQERQRKDLQTDLMAFGFIVLLLVFGLYLVGASELLIVGMLTGTLVGTAWVTLRG